MAKVKAGHNGELTFSITIQAEMLDPIAGLMTLFNQEMKRAMKTRDYWEKQKQEELKNLEQGPQIHRKKNGWH